VLIRQFGRGHLRGLARIGRITDLQRIRMAEREKNLTNAEMFPRVGDEN